MNNKKYVGSSYNIVHRINDHKSFLRNNRNKNRLLQEDWDKYGEDFFTFSILEELPPQLPVEEYRKHETEWMLKFNSHLEEFGYNIDVPDKEKRKKDSRRNRNNRICNTKKSIICISEVESVEKESMEAACEYTRAPLNKIWNYCNYWSGKNKRNKSYKGWMFVYKEEYLEDFDYFNFTHPRIKKEKIKINKYIKKSPEDIIPAQERQLKRVPIIATNIETGEEREFPMIKSCSPEFSIMKIYKCINNPFKKYKHRGHYFRKADIGG